MSLNTKTDNVQNDTARLALGLSPRDHDYDYE